MSQYKLKRVWYDEDTGISYAEIMTKFGMFSGTSQLHEEDRDIASKFQGCEYAKVRAIKKYLKAKKRKIKVKIDILKNIMDNFTKLKGYNPYSNEAKYIKKQYYIQNAEFKKVNQSIENLDNYLNQKMENYRKDKEQFYKKIEEKRSGPQESK